jgi:hypothetical protein
MKYWGTTTDFIANGGKGLPVSAIVETEGFTSKGDGGGAKWQKTANTGAASQTPAQIGLASFTDALGFRWDFIGNALFAEQIGGKLDGVTDNTLVTSAARAWSNETSGNYYIGKGTYVTGSIGVNSVEFNIRGFGKGVTEIKLLGGAATNAASTTGTARLSMKNLTLNQNSSTQGGAGHGIRGGGCDSFILDNVEIKDCASYGIGFQAGTNNGVSLSNIEIHGCGQDCIDIKDYNLDNGTIFITNAILYNFGLTATQQVAIDVRGHAIIKGADIAIQGDNRGVRLRNSGSQGRGGFGTMSNLDITSDGLGTSVAIDLNSPEAAFSISGVSVKSCNLLLLQGTSSIGGVISSVSCTDMYGADNMQFDGKDLIINGINLYMRAGGTRCIDFKPSCSGNQISNFNINTNSAQGARVQLGALNNALSSGAFVGGTVGDSGTGTVQSNVRFL